MPQPLASKPLPEPTMRYAVFPVSGEMAPLGLSPHLRLSVVVTVLSFHLISAAAVTDHVATTCFPRPVVRGKRRARGSGPEPGGSRPNLNLY